jgi:hypothetical protein
MGRVCSGLIGIGPELAPDAVEDPFQAGVRTSVVDPPTVTVLGEQAAVLHQPQMFRGDMLANPAGIGEFTDRVTAAEQQLDDPQTDRMRERAQTLGGAVERGWIEGC